MKKGHTLAEILVLLAIVGIVMGCLIPMVFSIKSNANAKLYYAAYKALMRASSQINGSIPFDSNFCNTMANNFNTVGTVNCTTSSYPNTPNFQTSNGMKWYGLDGNFYVSKVISVDVNGSKGPNQTNNDKLDLRVYWDKAVAPEGSPETSLINPSDVILECNKGSELGFCQTAMYMGWNQTCTQIHNAVPQFLSGVFRITPYGANGPEVNAYCDMATDIGGWTLVLNYLHQGGTDPKMSASKTLPLLGNTTLGVDESGNATTWGQANNLAMTNLDYNMTRFYCKDNGNSGRIVHFKSNACNTYFADGQTLCSSNITTNYTALTGHTGSLPASANSYGPQPADLSDLGLTIPGDIAMNAQPFYKGSSNHWNVGFPSHGHTTGRWECDDYPNDNSLNSYHQIWISGTANTTGGVAADNIIKQCNIDTLNNLTGTSSNCTTAYNNGWNLSCKQIKQNWKSAPDGYYALTPLGDGSNKVITFCDMTTNGGGYTLLASSQANSTADGTQSPQMIRNYGFYYLPVSIAQAVSNLSSIVRIADFNNPSAFIQSTDSYPIIRLQNGLILNDDSNKSNPTIHWTGSMTSLKYTGNIGSLTYPAIYWSYGATRALHFGQTSSNGFVHTWINANGLYVNALELWIK